MNPDPLDVIDWHDEPEDSGMVVVYIVGAFLIVAAVVVLLLVAGR